MTRIPRNCPLCKQPRYWNGLQGGFTDCLNRNCPRCYSRFGTYDGPRVDAHRPLRSARMIEP